MITYTLPFIDTTRRRMGYDGVPFGFERILSDAGGGNFSGPISSGTVSLVIYSVEPTITEAEAITLAEQWNAAADSVPQSIVRRFFANELPDFRAAAKLVSDWLFALGAPAVRFASLDKYDKQAVAAWLPALPISISGGAFTASQLLDVTLTPLSLLVSSRQTRLQKAMAHLIRHLNPDDTKTVMREIYNSEFGSLPEQYLHGVRDTITATTMSGIVDYIDSMAEFNGIGLRSKAITPLGGISLETLCDQVINILKNATL